MARYIDADKLEKAVLKPSIYDINRDDVIALIAEQSTTDVEEVKHAKWEINSDGYYPYCSNCYTEPKNGVMSKRCPECGAKMDGGNTE